MESMESIKSKENKFVKEIKKLNSVKYIKQENKILVDNIKVINEMLENDVEIECFVFAEGFESNPKLKELFDQVLKKSENGKTEIKIVTQDILKYLTDVENPQGVLCVLSLESIKVSKDEQDFILMLDNVQDPGNLGTIIRTMDSANLKKLIISKNSCYPFNPKVVRSTMGSFLRVGIEVCDILPKIEELKEKGYKILASSPHSIQNIYSQNFNEKVVCIIGNEANGISDEVLKVSDEKIKIPMLGNAESLNAGIATSVIIYEYVRQKLNLK